IWLKHKNTFFINIAVFITNFYQSQAIMKIPGSAVNGIYSNLSMMVYKAKLSTFDDAGISIMERKGTFIRRINDKFALLIYIAIFFLGKVIISRHCSRRSSFRKRTGR